MSTPGLIWTRPPRRPPRGPGRPPLVDTADIAAAAVKLLDRDGIEAMTMRALAEFLGLGVGTVYSHVPGREAIFDLACDAGLADLDDWYSDDNADDPDSPDWVRSVRAYLDGLRRLCETHRWWPILYPLRPLIGPNGMRMREQLLQVLKGAGFPLAQREPIMSALSHLAIGTMLIENTWRIWPQGDPAEVETVKSYVAGGAGGDGTYAELFTDYLLVTDPDAAREARWHVAVDTMLDGLATTQKRQLHTGA